MPALTLPKKSTGDHCHPPRASLTRFDPSVDRKLTDPVVRYERLDAEVRESGERRFGFVEDVGIAVETLPVVGAGQPVLRRDN